MNDFSAIVARELDGRTVAAASRLGRGDLPDHPVLVRVEYSALNYKDALALSGNRSKIMKSMPFVPGIDLAGEVVESASQEFRAGDRVVATGWGLGERSWGGYSEFATLKADWLTPLPEGMTTRHAMALGTAGLTALLCVQGIEQGGAVPGDGEVLVTGASGGVGSLALLMLAKLGHQAVALTGKPDREEELKGWGAAGILAREELDRDPRPFDKERWAAVIDAVGGRILANALAQLRYGGVACACGLAADPGLPASVLPFILRGVRLQGIDSVYVPAKRRTALWERLGELVLEQDLKDLVQERALPEVLDLAPEMLAGRTHGRTVLRVAGR